MWILDKKTNLKEENQRKINFGDQIKIKIIENKRNSNKIDKKWKRKMHNKLKTIFLWITASY